MAVMIVGLSCIACGGRERMEIPPPVLAPTPVPAPLAPRPTGLPALASCGVVPNYADEIDSPLSSLYRKEQLPLRISIAGDPDTQALVEGIKKGLVVWAVATQGIIGGVDIRTGSPDFDVFVKVEPHPVYDCRDPRTRWYGIFADPEVEPPRIICRGAIHICPENFQATPSDVLRVAKVVGHEMGHALGIGGHSSDPRDLMYGDDVSVIAVADSYPWVTERDFNTIGTAYYN